MLQELLLILFIIASLGIGFIFLFVFSIVIRSNSNGDRIQELSEILRSNRMAINSEQINLLYKIGKPDLSIGGYSESKMNLWKLYWEKEYEYEMRFNQDME